MSQRAAVVVRLRTALAKMELRINKECDVPVRDQVVEQVVYLILTAQIKPGQPMPSVRELGRKLQIHHNTVSEAYQELVRRKWLEGRRGTRLTVRPAAETGEPLNTDDLDDFINATLALARRLGFSDQALRERVRERLLAEPPDHILLVEQAPGLRQLLVEEIRSATRRRVESCSLDDLRSDHEVCIGALTVATPYALAEINTCLSKARQAVSVQFATAKEHLERIGRLEEPSVIAVVSISQTFLRTAQAVLAPALGARHTLALFRLPLESREVLQGADLVFCDSAAIRSVKHPRRIHYQLLAPESLDSLTNTLGVISKRGQTLGYESHYKEVK